MSIPRDTHSWAYQKQLEIILAMSPAERLLLGLRMCDDGRKILEASILRDQPHLSERELAVAVFERMHGQRYTPELRERIKASMLEA
jgi:hypothetical protein